MKEDDIINIPEFESAIKRGKASFMQLVEVCFNQHKAFNKDEKSANSHKHYHSKIFEAFEKTHGGIERFYEAENIVAAAILTDKGYFDYLCPIKNAPPVMDQLMRLSSLYNSTRSFLKGDELKTYASDLFAVSTYVLKIIDDCSTDKELLTSQNLKLRASYITQFLNNIERRLKIAAQRNSQIDYCGGMLFGCVIIFLVIITIHINSTLIPIQIVGTVLGGILGSSISVLTRLTNDRLRFQYEAGRKLIFLMGVFRPFIGASFAIFAWSFFNSDLVILKFKMNHEAASFFLVGFLAGFSERWTQDLITLSRSTILRLDKNPKSINPFEKKE